MMKTFRLRLPRSAISWMPMKKMLSQYLASDLPASWFRRIIIILSTTTANPAAQRSSTLRKINQNPWKSIFQTWDPLSCSIMEVVRIQTGQASGAQASRTSLQPISKCLEIYAQTPIGKNLQSDRRTINKSTRNTSNWWTTTCYPSG